MASYSNTIGDTGNFSGWSNCCDDANTVFYYENLLVASNIPRYWSFTVEGGRSYIFGHHVVGIIASLAAKHCGFEDMYFDRWNSPVSDRAKNEYGPMRDFENEYPWGRTP